jgi:hypothetical protein
MNMHSTPFSTTTGETRATAFKGVKASGLKRLNDDLLDLVRGAQMNGCKDLSLRELQQAYELRHSKRIELGTVSGAVTRLVAANKLVRDATPRRCNVTGREIMPFCAPAKQEGFL